MVRVRARPLYTPHPTRRQGRVAPALPSIFLLLGLLPFLLASRPAGAQQPPPDPNDLYRVPPGELPDETLLLFRRGDETDLGRNFLTTVPAFTDDVATSPVVFPDVPESSPFALLTLGDLVDYALDNNLQLINSERGVRIARSSATAAKAPFIPFVDLIANSRVTETRDRDATRAPAVEETTPSSGEAPEPPGPVDTLRQQRSYTNEAGFESGVQLRSGGSITASGLTTRTDNKITDGGGIIEDTKDYSSNVEIRYLQPLLRGGGTRVGTADLRRARIDEIDSILGDQVTQRDVVLDVISSYFQILQAARQLQVSRAAIQIRLDFLEETRVRFNVGLVDESEILRAEINYLNELETAISRQRQLNEAREAMLILLGLPLDTPISFIDITDELARRGRVDIPEEGEAVEEALDSRLELMRADLTLALSEIDREVTRNDLLPQLDFDAGYTRFDGADDVYESWGFENETWDAGLAFRLPLPNIERREAHRRSALQLEQQRTTRLSTERNIAQEVLTSRRSVLATEQQLTILIKSVESARKSLELITGRFEVGFEDITEVRLAQDELFQSETRYNDALLNYQVALARLYVALGRPLAPIRSRGG